jgi:hypothetical protein
MKKTFTLFALIFAGIFNAQSQSLEAWTWDSSLSNTVVALTNGTVVAYSTATNSLSTIKVKFKNTSSTNTYTYNIIRKDVVLHSTAVAYFCFGDAGSCYTELVTEPTSDFTVLGPGVSTSNANHLITDFQEANTIGYSEVNYKLFNMATGKTGPGADTLSWTFKFNQFMSVNENTNVLENISNVYPNPSTNNANLSVVLTDEVPVKVQVFNSLGALVYNGAEQQMNGRNKLTVDCTNFNNGLYFITVTAGNSKITKRLVVNK